MKRRRHGHDLIAHPAIVRVGGGDPLAVVQFSGRQIWFLLWRTIDEKEPRVEASRVEWWSDPAADEGEVVCVEIELVVFEQCGPRTASRLEIVEQRSALTFRQR